MSRKLLVALLMAAFASVPASFAYANPDDEDRESGKPSDLVVVIEKDLAK